jgi:hypothetical protein
MDKSAGAAPGQAGGVGEPPLPPVPMLVPVVVTDVVPGDAPPVPMPVPMLVTDVVTCDAPPAPLPAPAPTVVVTPVFPPPPVVVPVEPVLPLPGVATELPHAAASPMVRPKGIKQVAIRIRVD